MQELNEKILLWAKENGVLDTGNALQNFKTAFEKLSCLVSALIDQNPDEINKAIGEVNISLIIIKNIAEGARADSSLANSRIFMTANWLVEIFNKLTKNKDINLDIIRTQEFLSRVAIEAGFNLESCTKASLDSMIKIGSNTTKIESVKSNRKPLKKIANGSNTRKSQ